MEKNSPVEMTFGRAILKGIGGTVRFRGRASRSEFWYYTVFCFIMQIVLFAALICSINMNADCSYDYSTVVWLALVVLLALSHSAVSVRRVQDTDRNGWMWCAVYLIPWLIMIVALIWYSEYNMSLQYWRQEPQQQDPFIMNWAYAIMSIDLVIILITNILATFCFCMAGTEGPNRYGPDPLFKDKDNDR